MKKETKNYLISVINITSITLLFFLNNSELFATQPESIITDNQITIEGKISSTGFRHPGIGCSSETLQIMRQKVINGVSPWVDYFEGLRRTRYADLNNTPRKVKQITNNGHISAFNFDAEMAWTQTILYFVTGNEDYRKIPFEVIKWYSEKKDDIFFPHAFPDSHIKMGKPVYTLCATTDILRCITPKNKDLVISDEIVYNLNQNCIMPIRSNCIERNFYFMNQHTYAIMGVMASAILSDDIDTYKKIVEWTTVNATTVNWARSGDIKNQIRLVIRNDKTGMPVNPNLQVVEMGRDQAHAGGNVDNLLLMIRTMELQKTKIDPISGIVSNKTNAISPIHFLDDRLIKGSVLFTKYNLGYDLTWVPTIIDSLNPNYAGYDKISPSLRGRLATNGRAAAYYYFKGMGFDVDNGPYRYLRLALQTFKTQLEYNARSGKFIDTLHNNIFDFWIGLPEKASNSTPDQNKAKRALSAKIPPLDIKSDNIELENCFFDLSTNASEDDIYPGSKYDIPIEIGKDDDNTQYFRIKLEEKPRIVVLFYSLPSKSGFRIRSNNLVNLCLYSHPDYKIPIFESTVAPTNNKWKYISIDFKTDSIFYMEVSPLNGNSVIDFDRIDFNHDTFLPVQFNKISKHIVSYCGSSINKTFTANSPNKYLPNGIDNFLDSSSLELNSEKQQYVRLEHNILKGLDAFTISTWIYSKNLNTWERIFDFGSGISKYMFLTPSNRKNLPQFALKKSEESGEQIVESKISLSVNTWHHIAITLSNNIATIYIDGIKAGENTKMTVPFDLGETTNNYIGKSQYIRDPYFSGFLSNFTVYDKALSPEDINRLFTYGRRSSKEINNTLFKLNKSFIDSGQEKVTYSIYNLPSGAHFNTQTGELTWKPSLNQVGDYKLYVTAETDNSIDTQILSIHIAENKQNAIDYILKKYYDQNEKYSSSSINRLKTAIKLNDLNNLVDAATNLSLLTPRLSDNSIDYPKISTSNIKNINLLTDNNTFTWSGIWGRDDKNIVFDFGNDFKIKTTSFAIQCRDGFPIRASDVTVWGSNDSIKWIPLTENSTTKSSEMQYLKTKEEEKNNAYRYIRFLMPAKTYHIFEISELRIWGERIENLNTDKNDTYKK